MSRQGIVMKSFLISEQKIPCWKRGFGVSSTYTFCLWWQCFICYPSWYVIFHCESLILIHYYNHSLGSCQYWQCACCRFANRFEDDQSAIQHCFDCHVCAIHCGWASVQSPPQGMKELFRTREIVLLNFLQAVGPNLMLPTMLTLWGVVTTLQGSNHSCSIEPN